MKFLYALLFLVLTANFAFANKLPNVTLPTLPPQLPTEDPIQLISELSPECQGAFLSIVVNPEFLECVPVAALLPLITDPTLLPGALKDPLHNAGKLLPIVNAICAVPKCSDKGVATAKKAVEDGCKADLKNPLVPLALSVLEFYSPVRDIICFKNHDDELCIVETVTNVLSLPTPPPQFKLLGGIIDQLAMAEPKFICTPCNKAIVNTLIVFFTKNPDALEILDQSLHIGEEELKIGQLYFILKCGFQFVDGKVPDSTIDPKKFTYLLKDSDDKSSASRQHEMGLMVIGSLLASGLILN